MGVGDEGNSFMQPENINSLCSDMGTAKFHLLHDLQIKVKSFKDLSFRDLVVPHAAVASEWKVKKNVSFSRYFLLVEHIDVLISSGIWHQIAKEKLRRYITFFLLHLHIFVGHINWCALGIYFWFE